MTCLLCLQIQQIDSYCRTAGLVIAGYYHASEAVADMRCFSYFKLLKIHSIYDCNFHFYYSPDSVSQKICEKIAEYFPNACLVLINNRQLAKQMTQSAISVIQYSDGKWKIKDKEK